MGEAGHNPGSDAKTRHAEESMREQRKEKQDEGRAAFRAGSPLEVNPYKRSQWVSYYEWDSGWVCEQQKAEREALAAGRHDGR